MLCDLEPEEPFEELAADVQFERSMKNASLSLLRAIERARGFYPIVPPRRRKTPPQPIREAALGKGIVSSVAAEFELTHEELVSRRRSQTFINARAVATRLLRDQQWNAGTPRFSTTQIGRMLGGRDHSTVCHSLAHFEMYCQVDPAVREIYDSLRDDGE
jgi:hypothetical protein